MTDEQEKEELNESYLSWLSHPQTRRMIPQTEERIARALDQLVGAGLVSTDPKCVLYAVSVMSLKETLKSLRGDK